MQPAVTRQILISTCRLPFDSLNETLRGVLLEYTTYLMMTWPQWQNSDQYFSGKVSFQEFYKRFEGYIRDGVKELVDNEQAFRWVVLLLVSC